MDELRKYRQLVGDSKIREVTIGPDLAKVRPSMKIKGTSPQHIEGGFSGGTR